MNTNPKTCVEEGGGEKEDPRNQSSGETGKSFRKP